MTVMVFLAGLKLVSSSGIGSKKGALGQKQGRAIRQRGDARQATRPGWQRPRDLCVSACQLKALVYSPNSVTQLMLSGRH